MGGISNFGISGQPLINDNCHNFKTSIDIDMKLGPVTKFSEINTATSKKFHDKTMPKNCTVIKIFLKYGQFGAIQKLDSGRMELHLH